MAMTTMAFGVVLMALGIAGYFGTGTASLTALIPAAFGILLLVLGVIATQSDRARKHVMHLAAMFGVIGFVGAAPGLVQLPQVLSGGAVSHPAAVLAKSAMAILMAAFVGLCIRSFIAARRARRV